VNTLASATAQRLIFDTEGICGAQQKRMIGLEGSWDRSRGVGVGHEGVMIMIGLGLLEVR
jgi:hypothetical protein